MEDANIDRYFRWIDSRAVRDRASRASRVARDIQLANSIYRLSIEDAAVVGLVRATLPYTAPRHTIEKLSG
eukprot:scaffold41408_cov66-Phaeocystis_antarctica.AAC.2